MLLAVIRHLALVCVLSMCRGCTVAPCTPPATLAPDRAPGTLAPDRAPGTLSPWHPGTLAPVQNKPLRVLFIGNSLTYANELPVMVREIARAVDGVRIDVFDVAKPDFGLVEHWQDGEASRAIARGRWDVVVLQQGPSSQPDSRVILRDYVKRYDEQIRKVGARTALYAVWPSRARSRDFDGVFESYAIAAKDVGALLMPAGEAWRAAWRRDPDLPLYDRDGFHPSRLGSCLAALVRYKAIAGRGGTANGTEDRIFPPCVPRDTKNAADVRALLRAAASEAMKEQPR